MRGDNLLLDVHQKLLRFGQRQTQVGDVVKAIRPADCHQVETPRLTVNPSLIPSFYTVADWTTICFNLSSRRSISQGLRLNFGGTGMQARTCPRPYRIGA
ncbi:MAG: hypothetical protein ACJ8AW_27985 [Rhodopila sp.]